MSASRRQRSNADVSSILLPLALFFSATSVLRTDAFVAPQRGIFSTQGPFGISTPDAFGDARRGSAAVVDGTKLYGSVEYEDVPVCIIGGGVSGLTAAYTAASKLRQAPSQGPPPKILLLESSPTFGGRVQSDRDTTRGLTYDRGFAVFIEEYPKSKELLDYDELGLKRFLPGALVKLDDDGDERNLYKVADPLRRPGDLLTALTAPIGTLFDKVRVLPLLLHVFTSSIEELFDEEETDTLSCLKNRYGFSDKFVQEFFRPFLEGIYLAPLNLQSSRMFHFVFKMFSEGSATLPQGGMGKISDQLVKKVKGLGGEDVVQLKTDCAVTDLKWDDEAHTFTLSLLNQPTKKIRAKKVIVATDGPVARKLLSTLQQDQGAQIANLPHTQTQRKVTTMYYAFDTEAPVTEPILILNGCKGKNNQPVNNICFPTVVNSGYAAPSTNLCSVTILADEMENYRDSSRSLDADVRAQLCGWFPSRFETDIRDTWELVKTYEILNAQPSQGLYDGTTLFPANVNGGRDCGEFGNVKLPPGLYVCGDYMATATLNGALESGINAGERVVTEL